MRYRCSEVGDRASDSEASDNCKWPFRIGTNKPSGLADLWGYPLANGHMPLSYALAIAWLSALNGLDDLYLSVLLSHVNYYKYIAYLGIHLHPFAKRLN